ncbi:MAG: hypothetical protein JXR58_02180 [Bacteroidales bacterium]|nr:hypothetical protein [Bacteroidales bacterium]
MKKSIFLVAVFAASLLISSCGDKKESGDKETGQKVEKEAEIAYFTPEMIDLNKPVAVDILKEAVLAWDSVKEVTITGYCDFFFDKGSIAEKVGLKGSLDGQMIVECTMAEAYPEEFEKTVPVTIKGKIKEVWGDKIYLENCTLVAKGEEKPATGKYVVPQTYKGENVNINDFVSSYFGWKNKEIRVIGYYDSHTTSVTSYGTTIRVDLSKESMGEKMVGCEINHEVPEGIADNREGVEIQGKIDGVVFGKVSMVECKILNR